MLQLGPAAEALRFLLHLEEGDSRGPWKDGFDGPALGNHWEGEEKGKGEKEGEREREGPGGPGAER